MAKQINTRIALKYDSLANWNSSTIPLMAGEIAIATVASSAGNGLSEPVIMMKVGEDGVKTFSQLDWAVYAKASDVYGWAKKTEVKFVDEFLAMVGTDGATMQQKLDGVFATDTALSEAIAALEKKITDLSVSALEGRVADLEETVEGFGDIVTHNVVEFATAAQGATADATAATIATYGDIVTRNTSEFATSAQGTKADDAAAAIATYGDIVTHNASEFATAEQGTKADNAASKTYVDEELAKKQDIIPANTYDAWGSAAAVAGDLAEHEEAFASYQETVTTALNGKVDNGTYATDKQALEGAIALKADQTALANYYTKEEADTEFTTPTEVIEAVNKAIDDVANVDSITNITTLVEYANQNAGTIGALIEEVYGDSAITEISRIDTAVADSAQAKSDAAAAVSTANDASTAAGEAKALAEEAKEAAITAQESANASAEAADDSAQAAAGSASAAAGSAESAAESAGTASTKAGEASASAANAATSESNAAASAATAGEQASAASTSASAAAGSASDANNAKEAAVAAQGAAETAQGLAEEARDAAVIAKEAAEASNTSATAIANEAKGLAEGAVSTANTASSNATEALNKVNSLTTDDIDGGTKIWIFNCGTASTVI